MAALLATQLDEQEARDAAGALWDPDVFTQNRCDGRDSGEAPLTKATQWAASVARLQRLATGALLPSWPAPADRPGDDDFPAVADPALPTLGVRLGVLVALKDVVLALDPEMTTTDACFEVIRPLTSRGRTSFAELLQLGPLDGVGSADDVGEANRFVSHAWRYRFVDLVGALEDACRRSPDFDEAATFFWVRAARNSPRCVAYTSKRRLTPWPSESAPAYRWTTSW